MRIKWKEQIENDIEAGIILGFRFVGFGLLVWSEEMEKQMEGLI